MRRVLLGALAAALLGTAALGGLAAHTEVQAAERGREFAAGPMGGPGRAWARFTTEDRQAFAEARIAALHAGLKLNADQEKLWPPVEEAMRNFAKVRREQREARRERGPGAFERDLPGTLRGMADAGAARSEALRKLADATGPLYATLDEAQKRRALVLARPGGPGRGPHHGPHAGPRGPRGMDD
jgi:zinc resistance-associated protein